MKWLKLFLSAVLLTVLWLTALPAQPVRADTGHCGDIISDQTWSGSGNVHTIDCDVIVASGVTLTITEGAIIKFDSDRSLLVNGTLDVQGTESKPVYFTSYRDDSIGGDTNGDGPTTGARGDWKRIEFTDLSADDSTIDYAIIRYGGQNDYYHTADRGAIALFSASPTIQNTQLTENTYCAITADLRSFPTLDGNALVLNDKNGLCLLNINGDLTTNALWDITDTSYYVVDEVIQSAGTTLTIASGVIVKFNADQSLLINGTLNIQGTESSPAYITSYRDDSIGGDTNGDGPTTGARGDWKRIEFSELSSDASLINYAIIRYGGQNDYYHTADRGGIALFSASPTIQNTQLIDNSYCAITADLYSFPTLEGNTLKDNDNNGLCLLNISGDLTIDATWDLTDTSYYLIDSVTQAMNTTLTIASGVVVKINADQSLFINGTLNVQGTQDSPVYFTSYRDDTVGGDTDGDGPTTGARGDWTRIEFSDYSDDDSTIDHAVIRYGGQNDYYHTADRGGIALFSASPTIQNTQLTENTYCAITADLYSFPTLDGNTLNLNDKNGLCLLNISGDMTIDTTWDLIGTVYFLNDSVVQAMNTTLTIASGVIVKVNDDQSLFINGTLDVQGTATQPVYFTSYRDDSIGGDTNGDGPTTGARGDWRRIEFGELSNDDSLINYAIIRYAGYNDYYHTSDRGGIALFSASPTIQNTQLTDNTYCAITADLYSFPTLDGNTLKNNDKNGLCLLNISGDLTTSVLWNITDTSYYLVDTVTQAVGTTLTIANGVIVKVNEDQSLLINGTLDVQGTEDSRVYITSYRDDSVGGDTNGDGPTTGARGDWKRIEFTDYSNDASRIDYAIIRYGGYNDYYHTSDRGVISLISASPTIQNTSITDSLYAGIFAISSTPVLGCNNIANNTDYGIFNDTPTTLVKAEYQWWGVISGPYHPLSNPNGTGNDVTDGVDFIPWATAPCGMPPVVYIYTYLPLVVRH